MASADFNAVDAMRTVTLKVSGLKSLGIRVWIAARLIRLAARVVNVNVEFTRAPKQRKPKNTGMSQL